MTNRYYNSAFAPALGQLAQSAALKAQFDAITAALTQVQAEIDAMQGAGGITSLRGFPASFTGTGGKFARVNAAESALEFVGGGNLTIKTVGGTSYTLLATDAGTLLVFTNASAVTVTVPPSVLARGDVVCIRQSGAGQVTLVPGSGVSLNSTDNLLATRAQHAQIAVIADDGATTFGVIGERNATTLNLASLVAFNTFGKGQAVTPVALTDAATIATDASQGNHFTVTLGGNRTLGNPTNLVNGQILNWKVKQDGTGSRTLAFGSMFKWPGGTAPTLTTTAGARDFIAGQYFSDENIIVANCIKGVA